MFGPPGPPQDGVLFTGDVFTDGSRIGRCDVTAGIGWAVVKYDLATGDAELTQYGPMPAQFPVQVRILRAELWAVLQVLGQAVLPLMPDVSRRSKTAADALVINVYVTASIV